MWWKFKKFWRQWWYEATHLKVKPPKTLDLIISNLEIIIQHYKECQGESKPIDIRQRYKAAVAFRKKKIEEIGFRSPKSLEEAEQLRSWIIWSNGNRYGE